MEKIINWENYKCQFPERLEQAMKYIVKGCKILDVGAGDKYFKKLLGQEYDYVALNNFKTDDNKDLYCDLNEELINLNTNYDVITMIGVLEYVNDIDKVINWIKLYGKKIIITYSTLEGYGELLKDKYNSLNILTEQELKDIFIKHNFELVSEENTILTQKLFVFDNKNELKEIEYIKEVEIKEVKEDIETIIKTKETKETKESKEIKKGSKKQKYKK
jgi:2-polyprenyl-3-methyl-5-hydroxy-6-metoxy-1,4-benzoquinol methylase